LPVGNGCQTGQALALDNQLGTNGLDTLLQGSRQSTLPLNLRHDL
jgi:hypothetical protein